MEYGDTLNSMFDEKDKEWVDSILRRELGQVTASTHDGNVTKDMFIGEY